MKRKVAVIGSGVAGIVASYLLDDIYDVTIYEKNGRIGGHTHTLIAPDSTGHSLPVDTGFIVFNDSTYPNFIRFLNTLGIESQHTDMSFSYFDVSSQHYYAGTSLRGLFASPKNIFHSAFYKMLLDIYRFGKQGLNDLENNAVSDETLDNYVHRHGFGQLFIDEYLKPMGAAIWSTPAGKILDYPAWNFLMFFKNHGLLDLTKRPAWRTVKGGSHSYLKAFKAAFSGNIMLNADIKHVERFDDHITITMTDDSIHTYDHVVIATHADQALRLLKDPTEDEKRLLGPWQYSKNETVLHNDVSVMPPKKTAWASWNYQKEPDAHENDPVMLSYYMNRLQNLESTTDFFVTLNRQKPFDQEKIIKSMVYEHPIYTKEAVATQKELPHLNGVKNTYFCGSYFNHGFHEDAVTAGLNAAKQLGTSDFK